MDTPHDTMNRFATAGARCNSRDHLAHRRQFLGGLLAGGAAFGGAIDGASSWLGNASWQCGGVTLAADVPVAATLKQKQKRVLFLWLAGGASQFEMWDPKPGRETGGPFKAIATAVPGYQVCELMPELAKRMNRLAVIRSLSTGQSEHEQAADLISAGRPKEAALDYPEIGVVLAKELAIADSPLPDYISLFATTEGRRRPNVGFLGGRHAPVLLEDSLRPKDIDRPAGLDDLQHARREALRAMRSQQFAQGRAGSDVVQGYNAAYARVQGLMRSDALFDLEKEPAAVRDRYGRSPFGQHCLLARRLLEAGVPMVKVARGFWDSHHDNFESHRELVPDFDQVMSVLLDDLHDRGLLESTLILVFSEFGRTPKINQDVGRDHYAAAWSCALAGAGIRGGSVHGKTDADGVAVAEGKVDAHDLAATLFTAVGIDPEEHYQAGSRPVPLAREGAQPCRTVLL